MSNRSFRIASIGLVAGCLIGVSAGSPVAIFIGSMGVLMSSLTAEFSWGRAQIAGALIFLQLATIALSPFAGQLIDRYGARRVLLPAIASLGLIFLLFPFMTELWHYYAIAILVGAAGAGCTSLPYMRIVSAWFDRRRGLVVGIVAAGIGLGIAMVPPITNVAIELTGWKGAYTMWAVIVLVLVLPSVALLVRNSPEDVGLTPDGVTGSRHRTRPEAQGDTRAEAIRTGTFWLLMTLFFLFSLVFNGFLVHTVPMLTDRGMSNAEAVTAISILGVVMFLSRIAIGYLIDHYFAPRVALVAFLLSLVGVVMLASGVVGTMAFVAVILLGIAQGAETDVLAFLTGRYFGVRFFGRIYSLQFSAFLLGAAISPVVFGLAYEVTGSYATFLIPGSVVGLIACFGLLALGPYKYQSPHAKKPKQTATASAAQ